jgi:hypothetical protein
LQLFVRRLASVNVTDFPAEIFDGFDGIVNARA